MNLDLIHSITHINAVKLRSDGQDLKHTLITSNIPFFKLTRTAIEDIIY